MRSVVSELAGADSRPLRLAVVGAGRQGRRHLASAMRLSAQQNFRLRAVVDVDPQCAEHAQASGAEFFADVAALPNDVDACIVATPTATHFEVTQALLERGMDVLIEKPVTTRLAQIQTLVRLAEARERIFQVGYLERHHPAFSAVQPDFSAPTQISSRRSTMGRTIATVVDLVLELMIHDLDVIAAWLGDEPTEVIWQYARANGAEVAGLLELRFDEGHRVRLHAKSGAGSAVRKTVVRGGGEVWRFSWGSSARPSLIAHDEGDTLQPVDSLGRQLRAFVHSVRTRTPPLTDGRAALRAMRLAEKAIAALNPRA